MSSMCRPTVIPVRLAVFFVLLAVALAGLAGPIFAAPPSVGVSVAVDGQPLGGFSAERRTAGQLGLPVGGAPPVTKGSLPPVVPGFPNTAQTPGAILSGLNAPGQGRTAILAYHNGILYTVPEQPSSQPGADFLVRTWDLADPTDPVVTDVLGITPQPINAHGYFKSGDYLILGSNWPPEAPWSFRRDTPGSNLRTEFPDLLCAGVRGCLFAPFFIGDTWWSYGEIGGLANIQRDWNLLSEWDHLGETGVIGQPFLVGDLLIFASDQSRTGVATYDVSDMTNPVLLDVLTTGGPGGYWPEVWGGDGKLYVVFPYRTAGNGMRVVDATDPTDLQFVADVPLPGDESMYIQFQDEYAFMGSHKVDMRTFQSVLDLDGANTVRPNDGGTGIDTSQFLLPIGNLLVTGGIGPNEGMAIWAHQAAPDTRGPSVGYHRPLAGQANYPVDSPISVLIHETLESFTIVNGVSFIVRPLGGAAIDGSLTLAFDDILTFAPDQPLAADTTYEVVFPEGGIKDAAGNGMVGYSFTFSTGSSVGGNQAPEVQTLAANPYPASPAQSVSFSASATDPDVESLEYRYDFGDGSPKTAWGATSSASHAYAEAGHYKVTVQARDAAGALASRNTTVTVTTAPTGPLPTRSTPILCDEGGRTVFRVNPDADTLTAVHADSLAKLFEVPVCDDPRSVALSAQDQLWVSCHDDDTLRVLDLGGSLVDTLDVDYGSAPSGLVISPDGQSVFVALEGRGELRRYSASSRAETGRLALGPTPKALAVSPDGSRVLVTRFISTAHEGQVWEVETAGFTLARTLRIGKFGGDEHRDTTASGKGVANYLAGIALSPDGNTAWVASTKVNTDRGLLTAPIDLDSDNSVRNILSRFDLGTGQLVGSLDLDNSDSVTAIAYSPLADYLFATLQGSNEVIVLDALALDGTSGLGSLVSRLGTGLAPQGVCADADTNRMFVHDFMDRSVTALETDALFRTGAKTVASTGILAVASEPLTTDELLGKRVFYNAGDPRMSAEGYLSCATCHVDGGHDGRVWDFTGRGEGLRNTTTLRGRGGMDHGNVHWSANFDEIQDFEHDIRNAFGGVGFLTDAQFDMADTPLGPAKAGMSDELDDLAAYLSSLANESLPRSPHRQSNGALTAEGEAGRLIFQAQGCAECHSGVRFTDSTLANDGGGTVNLHDVGTLRTTSGQRLGASLDGIDTPSLLGVWNTAPYFHDGSAETLEAVFQVAGGTMIEAEAGVVSAGASVTVNYVDLNNDDSVFGRSFVGLNDEGGTLTLNNVDGGPGGVGALELRYSNSGTTDVDVVVNGGAVTVVPLPSVGNEPAWRHVNWDRVRLEGVVLTAGPTNTIVLRSNRNWPNVDIDAVFVSTAAELSAAEPHRRAQRLSSADQAALIAYLLQLDGTPEANPVPVLFADGFESGGTGVWSASSP